MSIHPSIGRAFSILIRGARSRGRDEDVAIFGGIGAASDRVLPNGDVLDSAQVGIRFRSDPSTVDQVLEITIDGGTTWNAVTPGALAWYTGTVTTPAADDSSGVHAANGDDVQPWPGPYTDPGEARNVVILFGASWAGGNVTVVGTDIDGAALTEVVAASAGALVAGAKAFLTITGITHASAGPGGAGHTATAGWGHALGIDRTPAVALGHLTQDGVDDAAAWDTTNRTVTPTQLPDGARTYVWAVPT